MSDRYTVNITDTPEWVSVSPTAVLRFVERDGKRILQQKFSITKYNSHDLEWRDVPMEAE